MKKLTESLLVLYLFNDYRVLT